ncbi:hypothetical protein lerEdw1_009048 [Lerista edwardsae]|nr:hypothetical protein lerEdw1_009048 [Lerista edwardsae]
MGMLLPGDRGVLLGLWTALLSRLQGEKSWARKVDELNLLQQKRYEEDPGRCEAAPESAFGQPWRSSATFHAGVVVQIVASAMGNEATSLSVAKEEELGGV